MERRIFRSIITGLKKNALGDKEIEALKALSLSKREALILADVLLENAKKYHSKSVLLKDKLDFSGLKILKDKSGEVLGFFKTFEEKLIPHRNFSDSNRSSSSAFEKSLDEVVESFEAIIRKPKNQWNNVSTSYPILFELEESKAKNIVVYTILKDLEKMGQKASETFALVDAYASYPTREKFIVAKAAIEKQTFDNPEEKERAFKWIESQEFRFLEKNKIHWFYLGIESENKKFLSSDLPQAKKQFIGKLQVDLEHYVSSTDAKILEEIKDKVTSELNTLSPNTALTNYTNHLNSVLTWVSAQKKQNQSAREKLRHYGSIYQTLQQNATLVLPLNQSTDMRVTGGSCFGYVTVWAKGLLGGEGKHQVLGVKPDDEPLFKIVDYSKFRFNATELNHVFFSTKNIQDLQENQQDIRLGYRELEHSSKKILYRLKGTDSSLLDEKVTDKIIDEIETKKKLLQFTILVCFLKKTRVGMR